MKHPELQTARLLKRYKRFLVDVEENGETFTIYCANTGAMTGCANLGFKALYSKSDNPKRKYQYSLEKTVNDSGHYIGVNTIAANAIVKEAIEDGLVPELNEYDTLLTEVKYGSENSRIDILLQKSDAPETNQGVNSSNCYVEVKSTTLLLDPESGLGAFPDAKTVRGQKHLRELMDMVEKGFRAVLIFLVQHTGIQNVTVAREVDPSYGKLFDEAVAKGVEILVLHTHIDAHQTMVTHSSQFNY